MKKYVALQSAAMDFTQGLAFETFGLILNMSTRCYELRDLDALNRCFMALKQLPFSERIEHMTDLYQEIHTLLSDDSISIELRHSLGVFPSEFVQGINQCGLLKLGRRVLDPLGNTVFEVDTDSGVWQMTHRKEGRTAVKPKGKTVSLGDGSVGYVKVVFCGSDQEEMACKKTSIDPSRKNHFTGRDMDRVTMSDVLHEIALFSTMTPHRDLVGSRDTFLAVNKRNSTTVYAPMRKLEGGRDGGELFARIYEGDLWFDKPFNEKVKVAEAFLRTASLLEAQGVRLCDIKAENLFLDYDKGWPHVIFIDWGHADSDLLPLTHHRGTLSSMPPEMLLLQAPHSQASERWAMLMVLIEILSGNHPLGIEHQDVQPNLKAFYERPKDSHVYLDLALNDISAQMGNDRLATQLKKWVLNRDPEKRPSPDDMLRFIASLGL